MKERERENKSRDTLIKTKRRRRRKRRIRLKDKKRERERETSMDDDEETGVSMKSVSVLLFANIFLAVSSSLPSHFLSLWNEVQVMLKRQSDPASFQEGSRGWLIIFLFSLSSVRRSGNDTLIAIEEDNYSLSFGIDVAWYHLIPAFLSLSFTVSFAVSLSLPLLQRQRHVNWLR